MPYKVRPTKICQLCGQEFAPSNHYQKSCGWDCPARPPAGGWPKSAVWFKTCVECGALFCSRRSIRITCGELCAKSRARRQSDQWHRENRVQGNRLIHCIECETKYLSKRPRGFCSDKCRIRRRRRYKTWRGRARHYGVAFENVTWRDVIGDWTCGICGEPIDQSLRWPDEMAVTVDHIVPMSKGGGHVRSNLQPAHWLCNVLKGADAEVDFRLEDESCQQLPSSTRPAATAA